MKQLTSIDKLLDVLESMVDASEPTDYQYCATLMQALATAHLAKQTERIAIAQERLANVPGPAINVGNKHDWYADRDPK